MEANPWFELHHGVLCQSAKARSPEFTESDWVRNNVLKVIKA